MFTGGYIKIEYIYIYRIYDVEKIEKRIEQTQNRPTNKTHTHIYIYIYLCICIYIYIYLFTHIYRQL